jgi:hypothetical protein
MVRGTVGGLLDFREMNKRALSLGLMAVSAVEFAPVLASITQPSDCACDQARLRPISTSLPDPEERPRFREMLVERASATSGIPGVAVRPGVGDMVAEGFAPTVS